MALSPEFFEYVTEELFYGSLPTWQKEPLNKLFIAAEDNDADSIPELAYIFATAYHESNRFKAKEEYGKGRAHSYGQPVHVWRNKKHAYYGRGWVQLTWLGNYGQFSSKLSALTGEEIDLVNDPDQILTKDWLNANICVMGMKEGLFTGKKLGDYITGSKKDYKNARRTVNGTDKADLIAGYAVKFEEALKL